MKSIFFLFFSLLTFALSGQDSEESNVGNLTLKFFKVERTKVGGNTDLELKEHFEYLHLFEKGQRFAPDEPSSFSSLEFTFSDKKLRSNFSWEQSIGIYRNHTKGDLVLTDEGGGIHVVHFGLGNSQVGISSTGVLDYSFKKIKIGYFLQIGVGANVSRFSAPSGYAISPKKWGYKGAGITSNTGLQIASPKFWNRFIIRGFFAYNISYSRYRDFRLDPVVSRPISPNFKNINFTTGSKKLSFSISLSYDILKRK